jgi:hypothetical protein
MGYWTRGDLEDAMSPATVAAIFDDAGAADGTINGGALKTVELTPAAHTTNAIVMNAARISYVSRRVAP